MIWSLTDAITPPRLGAGRKVKRRKMTAMERRGPGVECAHNHKKVGKWAKSRALKDS